MPATSFWTPGRLEEGGLLLYPSPQGTHTQVYKLDSWRKGASFSTEVVKRRPSTLDPTGRRHSFCFKKKGRVTRSMLTTFDHWKGRGRGHGL
jgi:hypothetical protein